MTLMDFISIAVSVAIGWLLGTVYPLWQPAEEPEESEYEDGDVK